MGKADKPFVCYDNDSDSWPPLIFVNILIASLLEAISINITISTIKKRTCRSIERGENIETKIEL